MGLSRTPQSWQLLGCHGFPLVFMCLRWTCFILSLVFWLLFKGCEPLGVILWRQVECQLSAGWQFASALPHWPPSALNAPEHRLILTIPADLLIQRINKSPWTLLQGAITILVCISSSHTLKYITKTLWPLWRLSCLSCLLDTLLCPPVWSGLFFYIPFYIFYMLLGRAAKGSEQQRDQISLCWDPWVLGCFWQCLVWSSCRGLFTTCSPLGVKLFAGVWAAWQEQYISRAQTCALLRSWWVGPTESWGDTRDDAQPLPGPLPDWSGLLCPISVWKA